MMKLAVTLGFAALCGAALASSPVKCGSSNLVEKVVATPSLSTLTAAVKAAGLVDALKSGGPFTIFAPSDAAFKKLEKAKPGILSELLKPENKEKLVAILKYHVIDGSVTSSAARKIPSGTQVGTLNGAHITVSNSMGLRINGAKVLHPDIMASNGVIHVIDAVLIPN